MKLALEEFPQVATLGNIVFGYQYRHFESGSLFQRWSAALMLRPVLWLVNVVTHSQLNSTALKPGKGFPSNALLAAALPIMHRAAIIAFGSPRLTLHSKA